MTWHGFTATYSHAEQAIMAAMRRGGCSASELAFVHEAKSRFDGRLSNPMWHWTQRR